MGIFDQLFVREHLDLSAFPVGVETGTCLGYSTNIMQRIFRKVYTIELDEQLYEAAARDFVDSPTVTCVCGDSSEKLPQIIETLEHPTLFFLDAHWSGDHRVDWSASSWKGYPQATSHRRNDKNVGADVLPTSQEQTPLLQEIMHIMNFPLRCAIYVDDLDKFASDGTGLTNKGFEGEDWSHLDWNAIVDICRPRLEGEYYKSNDQALLILKSLGREEVAEE